MSRLLVLAAFLAAPAAAQDASTPTLQYPLPGVSAPADPATVPTQPPPAPAPAPIQGSLGVPLSLDKGPWVLGEVLFFSGGKIASDYSWRDRVRGSRGALYTRADVLSDVDSLMALNRFESVAPAIYEIPGAPVPPDFVSIAASTSQVRLVFNVVEKAAPPPPVTGKKKKPIPPAAVSGIIFTPTAWRGAGKYSTPGLGLDINAVYMIGRLYGKNNLQNTTRKTNYIDRIGVWLLSGDGKMQVQSEGTIRPAVAVGGQGVFMFRDSPQPNVNDPAGPTVSVNASQKSTKILANAYFVSSKKLGPIRSSAGIMQGQFGDVVGNFSEFLTPDSLRFHSNRPNTFVRSRTIPFASLLYLPKPEYPMGVEYMKFNGAALNPWMLNFKVGYFLKLNFDIAFLKFDGGYDLIGMLQFRFNQFPRR